MQNQTITITTEQLASFAHELITGTLRQMGLHTGAKKHETVTRTEMVRLIGRQTFDRAVNEGLLKVQKKNPDGKTSKIYATATDWSNFIKQHYA